VRLPLKHGHLALLTLAATAGVYARTTLGPLQETLSAALSLSDNQIALLQGPALALPLAASAIPLGLAIDRYSRVHLLLLATLINLAASVTTAIASSFVMLFVARCLVGLATPMSAVAAYSLLADIYPSAQRGRAIMTIVLGQAGGASLAFALGGSLLASAGAGADAWRQAMLWMAVPLAPVSILILLLREPSRSGGHASRPPVREIWPELWRYRGVLGTLVAGVAVVNLADGAAMIWAAPTLARNFDLPADRIGAILGTALLVSGVLGPVVGGALADVCQRTGGPRRTINVLCGLTALSVPASLFALMPGAASAGVPLTLFLALGAAISVMTTAVAIVVMPNELRGLCVTLKFAVGTLFGLGIAPFAVSFLSSALGGRAQIGASLAWVCVSTSLFGTMMFALGKRYFPRAAT
jgi:MFS family permease